MEKQTKTVVISCRITPEEKRALKEHASILNTNMSTYLKEVLNQDNRTIVTLQERMQELQRDNERLETKNERHQRVNERLDERLQTTNRANEALEEALYDANAEIKQICKHTFLTPKTFTA